MDDVFDFAGGDRNDEVKTAKKKKKGKGSTVSFDEKKRRQFVNGFRRRKLQRQEDGKKLLKKFKRKVVLEARQKRRVYIDEMRESGRSMTAEELGLAPDADILDLNAEEAAVERIGKRKFGGRGKGNGNGKEKKMARSASEGSSGSPDDVDSVTQYKGPTSAVTVEVQQLHFSKGRAEDLAKLSGF